MLPVGGAVPAWIAPSLRTNEGRDPLGLQTTTQDRLMPRLLPGILELSKRGRYFSFHAFLLAQYQDQHLPANSKSQAAFIRRCEWDFGLAVLRCPRKCGSGPVGARRLRQVIEGPGPFPGGESVESPLGGYGLYYRSPMAECGIVARAGTMLGEKPITVDVLYDSERARRLAAAFKQSIQHTAYYRQSMWRSDTLSEAAVVEYAEAACLCRLRDLADERAAVHEALFGFDTPGVGPTPVSAHQESRPDAAVDTALIERDAALDSVLQRRRSVGHFLSLIAANTQVATSIAAYREALWAPPLPRNQAQADVAGQWAALIAKDVWQEALCSAWSEFCRAGLSRTRALGRGLTWQETRTLVNSLTSGPPILEPTSPTIDLDTALAAGRFTLPSGDGDAVVLASASLEQLRQLTSTLDSACSGLVVLLELARRTQQRSGTGWEQACRLRSDWQPSISEVTQALRTHLADRPTIGDTLWWLVSRFIIPVHERIAYSKMPEFTFRFRWEDGLLRFYDHGARRFPLAGIRHEPLASLTHDLALWTTDKPTGSAVLTPLGATFAAEALV